MWRFSQTGPSGFSGHSTAEEVIQGIDGTGLTANIVTGASSGIGSETARVLALRGVHVVMGVRNMSAGMVVKETITKDIPTAKIDAMELDLSSIASVRNFAADFNSSGLPLNILINNAGVLATPFTFSKDNIELQFATNHLGHFLLTNLLLEAMKTTTRESSKEGIILNVSSRRHQFTYPEGIRFGRINDQSEYNSLSAYGQSKLAIVLHANELARRLKEEGLDITANALHPGAIATNLFRYHSLFSGNLLIYWQCLSTVLNRESSSKCPGLMGFMNLFGKYVIKNVQQKTFEWKNEGIVISSPDSVYARSRSTEGAATTCYVALHPQVKGKSGKYLSDCNLSEASLQANDTELAKKLWDFSSSLISKCS